MTDNKIISQNEARQELTKLVIMALHPGMSYGEALLAEWHIDKNPLKPFFAGREPDLKILKVNLSELYKGSDISLARVMAALDTLKGYYCLGDEMIFDDLTETNICPWKLTDENGRELYLDSQSIETIEALIKLLTPKSS